MAFLDDLLSGKLFAGDDTSQADLPAPGAAEMAAYPGAQPAASGSGGFSPGTRDYFGTALGAIGAGLLTGDRYHLMGPGFLPALRQGQKDAEVSRQQAALRAILKEANPGLSEQQLDAMSSSPDLAKIGLDAIKQKAQAAAGADATSFMGQTFGAGGAGTSNLGMGAGAAKPLTPPEGTNGEIQNRFIGTLKQSGLTNPNALGAFAAYAQHESSYDPNKIVGSWSDPSESGQPGVSGGILSWRGDRFANMQKATAGAKDPVTAQAEFALKENPQLTAALQAAQSPEEAHALLADAWKFAGYNRAGGENAARLATTRAYASRFASAGDGAPQQVAQAPDAMPTDNRPAYAYPVGNQPGAFGTPTGPAAGRPAQVASVDPRFMPQGPSALAPPSSGGPSAPTSMPSAPGMPGAAPRAPSDTRIATADASDPPVMVSGYDGRTWTRAQAQAAKAAGADEYPEAAELAAAQQGVSQARTQTAQADRPAPGAQDTGFFIPDPNGGPGKTVYGKTADYYRSRAGASDGAAPSASPAPAAPAAGFKLNDPAAASQLLPGIITRLNNPNLPDASRKQLEWARDQAIATLKPSDRVRQLMEQGYAPGTPEYRQAYKDSFVNKPAAGFRGTSQGNQEYIPGSSADPAYLAQKKQAEATESTKVTDDANQRKTVASDLGLTPGTPDYQSYVLTGRLPGADGRGPSAQFQARAQAAQQQGLQPGTPEYQAFVLTGKPIDRPQMSATEQKMFADTDKRVKFLGDSIDSLKQARDLNDSIHSGAMASYQTAYDRNAPSWAPFANSQTGANTALYNNLIKQGAMASAKEFFPGRVTNYDEQLMQSITPDAGKSAAERKSVLDHMIQQREQLLAHESDVLSGMKSGTYFRKAPAGRQAGQGSPSGQGGGVAPSSNAVGYLRANPQYRDQFDAKYGAGAADRVLEAQ